MIELEYTRRYAAADEGLYDRIPFEMPDNIGRIEIEYDYKRYERIDHPEGIENVQINLVDMGIYDQNGNLSGWSGSERQSVYVDEVSSTPGYTRGKLCPGKWAVALGIARVTGEVEIKVSIRLFPNEQRILKGELHCHSLNSDGSYPSGYVIDSCARNGLDFAAITDHNTTKQIDELRAYEGITVIPGIEFTNVRGHANIYFDDPSIQFEGDFVPNDFEGMASLFRRAKELGGIISLNHVKLGSGWTYGYEGFPFDMIEIWNGPMEDHNMRAIGLWHQFLCEGKKMPAVGGSDAHVYDKDSCFGLPCNFLKTWGRSPKAILGSLMAGHNCISFSPSGPYIEMSVDKAITGDTVSFKKGLNGCVSVSGIKRGDIVKVLNGGGIVELRIAPFNGTFTAAFDISARGFYRAELYRRHVSGGDILIALCNPVYVE
jgi:hypothetical protein